MKMKILKNTYIRHILKQFKFYSFCRKWKKINNNNKTVPVSLFNPKSVLVGKYSYGELNIISFSHKHKLIIGNYVSIAQNVHFLLDAEHYINTISTYPFKVKLLKNEKFEAFGKGNIIIEDDVWIGYGATIMSGVCVRQGAVVAAGAVVTEDIPPYAIVGGVPAKVIKYRFSSELIQELLKVDYSKLTKEMIKEHKEELYMELTDCSQLAWLPKK